MHRNVILVIILDTSFKSRKNYAAVLSASKLWSELICKNLFHKHIHSTQDLLRMTTGKLNYATCLKSLRKKIKYFTNKKPSFYLGMKITSDFVAMATGFVKKCASGLIGQPKS